MPYYSRFIPRCLIIPAMIRRLLLRDQIVRSPKVYSIHSRPTPLEWILKGRYPFLYNASARDPIHH